MQNPPNARHWYEHVPRGPKRSLEILPSEARIQMVNATTLLRTHKVNGNQITIKAGNQMDVIDLENKAIYAKTLN
jgi:hypothetical protein